MQLNPAALTTIRELAGLSQAELARRSGVSQVFISEIEAGKKGAGPGTIKKLASALAVPIPALVTVDLAAQP